MQKKILFLFKTRLQYFLNNLNKTHYFFFLCITEELDLGVLNEHQTKRLEIECQVRVLELESSLEKERMKLSTLRKLHYQEDQS